MSRVVGLPKVIVLSLGMLALAASPADAQEIQWRSDYNKARQEAKEKNLPVLMDVGTNNCFWCGRLDATTFRDPAVIKLINENFIPLRVDGNKYKSLTDALNIKYFPALVFALPQGKVIALREGYLEPPQFYGWAQQVLTTMNAPQAGPAGAGLQLTGAQKPAPPVTDRVGQARAMLAQAQEEFRTQQYVCCLMRCKVVAASFPDLPEGVAAQQLAAQLKNDPDRLRVTSEQLTQSLCELYLELAGTLIAKGQREQAVPYLQWIRQACPDTPHAANAAKMLGANSAAAPAPPVPPAGAPALGKKGA